MTDWSICPGCGHFKTITAAIESGECVYCKIQGNSAAWIETGKTISKPTLSEIKIAYSALLDYLISVSNPSTFIGITTGSETVLDGHFNLTKMVEVVLESYLSGIERSKEYDR